MRWGFEQSRGLMARPLCDPPLPCKRVMGPGRLRPHQVGGGRGSCAHSLLTAHWPFAPRWALTLRDGHCRACLSARGHRRGRVEWTGQSSERRALGCWGRLTFLGGRALHLEGQVVIVLVEGAARSEAEGGATQARSGSGGWSASPVRGPWWVGAAHSTLGRARPMMPSLPGVSGKSQLVLASRLLHRRPWKEKSG